MTDLKILDLYASLKMHLPPRARDGHKGTYGSVLAIGGAPGFAGAIRLTAEAALRTGAGKVIIVTHPQHANFLSIDCPELMCHGITYPNQVAFKSLLERATVIAIGPGLGQPDQSGDWSLGLLSAILNNPMPQILDADALNILAMTPSLYDHLSPQSNRIWTPHVGEAARLLNTTPAAIQADRPGALRALQARLGGVVVLKGAGTLIGSATTACICTAGNPGMATAGMGDVLTGIIAGLLAQGLNPQLAAECGVYMHALAGDRAAIAHGERGMIARDIFPYIRQYLNLKD